MAPGRRPIVGGNWKMNTTLAGATELARGVAAGCRDLAGACDVIVYPPFPYLEAVGQALRGSGVLLGAQDCFYEARGAYTGEVSPAMLADVGVRWVLAGHSERRHLIGETDEVVGRKVGAALEAGLSVVLCVGETEPERLEHLTEQVVLRQVQAGLAGVPAAALDRVSIAYEPFWAIGTGRVARPGDCQAVHELIRRWLGRGYHDRLAAGVRIQYGGSLKAGNAAEIFAQGDVDGGLVGGASLQGDEFVSIVRVAVEAARAPQPSGSGPGRGKERA
jgi:triosephosphate isomerase